MQSFSPNSFSFRTKWCCDIQIQRRNARATAYLLVWRNLLQLNSASTQPPKSTMQYPSARLRKDDTAIQRANHFAHEQGAVSNLNFNWGTTRQRGTCAQTDGAKEDRNRGNWDDINQP